MAEREFEDAVRAGVTEAGDDAVQQMERARQEIDDIIEEAREAIDAVLGEAGSAAIEPALSTDRWTGQQIVLRKPDGYDVKAFTVRVPVSGYPVTICVRDEEYTAGDAQEFRDKLKEVLSHPDVGAAAQYVLED